MTRTASTSSLDPAATLGVSTGPKDPELLSVHTAAEALRVVHALDDVDAAAPLAARPDRGVPGAHYVDTLDDPSHPRYWVGLSGEVLSTHVDEPVPGPNPEVRRARTSYTAAVEAVRLAHRVSMEVALFAVPDVFVAGAFFVHEAAAEPAVRWVDATGGVHDGYRLLDGAPVWDGATVSARHDALRAQPSTAGLVDPS